MSEPVRVDLGECKCDGTPHESDVAFLRPVLGLEGGLATLEAIKQHGTDEAAMTVALGIAYLTSGIVSWNLSNGTGMTLPLDAETITHGVEWSRMLPIAEKAAELYGESVLAPLVAAVSRSSQPGPTNASTSPTIVSSSSRRKRSRPSTTGNTRHRR